MNTDAAYRREFAIPGNSFQRQYALKTSGGAAVELTGYNLRWTGYYGDNVIVKTTEDNSLSMPNPVDGTVTLDLVAAETRLIPENASMKYQLEIYAGNYQFTVLYGDLVGRPGGDNAD